MTADDQPVPRAPAQLAREDGRSTFGAGAAGYHATRSDYPDELYDALFAAVAQPAAILEIGPGSGLATAALLQRAPRRYVAVESDPDFVAFLGDRFASNPLELVCAPFPCAGVEGPFDLAVCAAAFHWLEPKAALAELRRLLHPRGVWAMWWNSYLDETDDHPFARAAMVLMRARGVRFPPSFGAEGHLSLDHARQTALLEANGFCDVEFRQWRRSNRLDAAGARGLFDSFSFVRLLAPPVRAELLDSVVALVNDHFGGLADNLVSTTCYIARPAPAARS